MRDPRVGRLGISKQCERFSFAFFVLIGAMGQMSYTYMPSLVQPKKRMWYSSRKEQSGVCSNTIFDSQSAFIGVPFHLDNRTYKI